MSPSNDDHDTWNNAIWNVGVYNNVIEQINKIKKYCVTVKLILRCNMY